MTEPSTFSVRGLYWLTHEPIPPTTEAERAAVAELDYGQPDRHRLADMLGITLEPRR